MRQHTSLLFVLVLVVSVEALAEDDSTLPFTVTAMEDTGYAGHERMTYRCLQSAEVGQFRGLS